MNNNENLENHIKNILYSLSHYKNDLLGGLWCRYADIPYYAHSISDSYMLSGRLLKLRGNINKLMLWLPYSGLQGEWFKGV